MKHFVSALLFACFASSAQAQFDLSTCDQVGGDSCRIRIVTLSSPQPWRPIPIPFVVVQEGKNFVFYSQLRGTYCDMLRYLEAQVKGSEYTDARVVVVRRHLLTLKKNEQ